MSHNSRVRRGVVVRIEKAFRMFDIDPVVGNFQRHLDRVCPRCFKAVMQIIRNSPEKDLQPFFLPPTQLPPFRLCRHILDPSEFVWNFLAADLERIT